MKNILPLISLLVAIVIILPAHSQADMGGFFAGINLAGLTSQPEEEGLELSSRTGFMIGGMGSTQLGTGISLTIAPAFIQRGTTIEATLEDPSVSGLLMTKQTWRLNYIDVPVLLRITFKEVGKTGPYFLVGPNFGVLLNAKARVESVSIDGDPQTIREGDVDIKEVFKTVDIGVNVGSGIEIPVGNNAGSIILLEATYNLGISNIGDTPDGDNSSIKNKGFQLKTGVIFPVRK